MFQFYLHSTKLQIGNFFQELFPKINSFIHLLFPFKKKESHGDWFGVEHGSDVVDELSKKFGVSGIPYLVVLKSDGTVITKDGRSAVQRQGAAAIKTWKK